MVLGIHLYWPGCFLEKNSWSSKHAELDGRVKKYYPRTKNIDILKRRMRKCVKRTLPALIQRICQGKKILQTTIPISNITHLMINQSTTQHTNTDTTHNKKKRASDLFLYSLSPTLRHFVSRLVESDSSTRACVASQWTFRWGWMFCTWMYISSM